MLEYAISVLTDRTDHPILFSLFILGALFAVTGGLVETFVGNGVAAGFLVIYAMMASLLGGLAYLVIYVIRFTSALQNRSGSV